MPGRWPRGWAPPGGLQWTDYPGGGILQAGAVPRLGDFEQGLIPSAYVAADELLRPVRARYDEVILTARVPGLATRDEREAFARNWLDRFADGRP